MFLACLSFAACPLETDGPNPPLSSVHIQHHRQHTSACKLQQVDNDFKKLNHHPLVLFQEIN